MEVNHPAPAVEKSVTHALSLTPHTLSTPLQGKLMYMFLWSCWNVERQTSADADSVLFETSYAMTHE